MGRDGNGGRGIRVRTRERNRLRMKRPNPYSMKMSERGESGEGKEGRGGDGGVGRCYVSVLFCGNNNIPGTGAQGGVNWNIKSGCLLRSWYPLNYSLFAFG